MRYLLNAVYLLLLVGLSPWLVYTAVRKGKYRTGWRAKLLGWVPRRSGTGRCIWLHAVSAGEVNLLRPVLAQLEQAYPDCECVISTTTKTGYALARDRFAPRSVFYCPLDFSWSVAAALRRIRPTVLVLAELELWPNLISAAHRRGTRIALINGRLSERSARGYARIRPLVRHLLRSIDVIAVQDQPYADRFRQLGAAPESLHVTGSIKFDGARCDRTHSEVRHLAQLAGIRDEDVVFLAGSTQRPEESLALATYLELQAAHPELRLILVPRHDDRFEEVAELLRRSGVGWQRRSELDQAPASASARILLVDVVGELAAWWGTAHLAFVGGSMGSRGGQNMIEPAAYGAAVSFGPNTHNFREIVALMLSRSAAQVVHDGCELTTFVRRGLEDPGFAHELGARAQQLVAENQGATRTTVQKIGMLLGSAAA